MIWLGIDTANSPLSVALVEDGRILCEQTSTFARTHSIQAMPAIERLLSEASLRPSDLEAIAVSEGPGSYTGVRIGVTLAKTLAWTLKIPIVGVSSLEVIAANAVPFEGVICPLFDARRENVYCGLFKSKGERLERIWEDRHGTLTQFLEDVACFDQPVLFVGMDVEIHKTTISTILGDQAVFAPFPQQLPRASQLISIAEQRVPEPNVHQFVPKYRRIPEAEANWIKEQKQVKSHD
ncbi:tRNA (adenosine(37)-N6)-threonylcarbamoyltransferase complex dimerization subunit type 1 TsaB [Sporosarcina sp. BI001-red]|uniref:tRNA (adenosine(37)-N6)-threonylcarbamoyltransferase complex dimerization subunit type 1 TsaB n=1 Tax=Sporosarcina sp. BI001-red TaxID=2282866 RepID=UPI000E21DB47|nr:tRNA (adenosine(37)-N6)-threonylcarbamoyltransferase complex dimerization subunit type 1 TsaB [Sporosarcina sp. BI001-red]REB10949.1 tRNA (adenosine(37)-N6)-threonylcarbamoyltransferase complex dimerization subunit type 1 TsaB [Sporosarcina sp. BI001-red]